MTRLFRDFSIRNKLIAIILVSTIASLGIGFGFVIASDILTFKRDMVDHTVTMARVAGDYSVSELAFGDRSSAASSLEKLASSDAIRSAFLYDAGGKLFSSYRRDPPTASFHGGETTQFSDPATVASNAFRGGMLHVTEPVEHDGSHYGTLVLVASTRDLDRKIRAHVITMVSFMFVLALASVLFARRLQRVISEPILDLAAAARQISVDHNYGIRVEKAAGDEVGALCDGFNEMLGQIEKRQHERDEADQRSREKSQFLANMSHELRTPLNAIIGFSEILRTRLASRLEPKELKFIDNINSSGQHLLGLVNDILDLSKVEAGHMEMHTDMFWVGSAIEGVAALMKGISGQRGIVLEVSLPPELPPLEADPVKIKQVLYNLLSNAVRFSPERSTVTVGAALLSAENSPLDEESIEITVTDQGIGIDPKDHELIFQEFQQVDGSAVRRFQGTGLGLTLVRKFVELHRGIVRVASALGEGSTFTVTLPTKFRGVARPDTPVSLPLADSGRRQKILVIEDDDAAYATLEGQLTAASYLPLRARTGEQGIKLARSLKPAAITLDLVLPGMDGWEVLKTLKADAATAGIPVIIVSMIESRELGFAFGADDYLLKPLDSEDLIRRLRRLSRPRSAEVARLLLIDDDPNVHELLDRTLAGRGYRIDHAYDGHEGIARAIEHPPALIILDLLMPGLDGFEVAVRLKSDPATAGIPILLVTAKDLTVADRQRLQGKVAALFEKDGITGKKLVATIQDLVERHVRQDA